MEGMQGVEEDEYEEMEEGSEVESQDILSRDLDLSDSVNESSDSGSGGSSTSGGEESGSDGGESGGEEGEELLRPLEQGGQRECMTRGGEVSPLPAPHHHHQVVRVHYLTPAPRRRLRDLRAVRKAVRKAAGAGLPDTCFSFLPRRLGLPGEVVREARTEAVFTYKTTKIYHFFESQGEERGGRREFGRCKLCGEEGGPVRYYTFLSHMKVGKLG